MDRRFVVAVSRAWATSDELQKRAAQQLFPIGKLESSLRYPVVLLRFRDETGALAVEEVKAQEIKGTTFLKAPSLWGCCARGPIADRYLLMFVELSGHAARVVVTTADDTLFELLGASDPPLRPDAYDLPPRSLTTVDADDVYSAIYDLISKSDAELFSLHADHFLGSPHILVPLFAHVLSLSSSDNIDFPLLLKTFAEQLRTLLCDTSNGKSRIKRIERNHAECWHDVLGERIAFLDAGAARISGVPSTEPLALRVGIYAVTPGETDLSVREDWVLAPYVVGDLIQPLDNHGVPDAETGDLEAGDAHAAQRAKRLQEASRYVLEALTAKRYLETRLPVAALFTHGPLVNQFTEYDEGPPAHLPLLDSDFLGKFGITEDVTRAVLTGVPPTADGGSLWNQFMCVYGVVMRGIFSSQTPVAGVVERSGGRWLGFAVINGLLSEGLITEAYAKRFRLLIERFKISDDFLFGCLLKEGEYIEPVPIPKNAPHRARPRWQEVVRQYPSPHATILKTSGDAFPFRVEMNPAAFSRHEFLLRLLYHTSRLLPRYAFPVGLDIVDKYAKVPDWLSRGISSRISAEVLRRALRTGDAELVAQIRQFLARSPRDFFYRPQV